MLNLTLLLALAGPVPAQSDLNAPQRARVTVQLPGDAKLYVEGVLCPKTGATRSFDSPPIQPGRSYSYDLRAEIERDGKTVSDTKTIKVRPGQTTELDWRDLGKPKPAAAVAAKLPEGEPPMQGTATLAGGTLQLQSRVYKMVTEQRQATVTVEGRPETRSFTVARPVAEEQTQSVKAAEVQAYEMDGTPINTDRLADRLRGPTTVLFTFGRKPDPAYLRIYKEGTVVLVLPMPRPVAPMIEPTTDR